MNALNPKINSYKQDKKGYHTALIGCQYWGDSCRKE